MAFYDYLGNPVSRWTQSSSEYSASEFHDPNSYSYYTPTPPLTHYFPETSYSISHMNTEPEIEFWEEYDPTRYDTESDAGKDQVLRSAVKKDKGVESRKKVRFAEDIAPSSSGNKENVKKKKSPKKVTFAEDVVIFPSSGNDQDWNRQAPDVVPYSCENDQEWNRKVRNQHGSGLESVDLCESVFGYWPCEDGETRRSFMGSHCSRLSFREPFSL